MTFGEERHHYVPCSCAWLIPALLSRCNRIVCKHDSAWGKDHHVSVHMLSKRVFFSTWKLAHFTLKQCFWNNIVKKGPCSVRAWGVSVHLLSNRVFFSTWKFAHFTLKQCFWNTILRKVACSLRAWFWICVITQITLNPLGTVHSWRLSIFMKPEATSNQAGQVTHLKEFPWRFGPSMLSEHMHYKHLVLTTTCLCASRLYTF